MPSALLFHRRRLITAVTVIAIVISLAASVFIYRRHQIAVRFGQWRSDGMAADARHDANAAVDLLGRYLARYPDDVAALTRYADDRLQVALPDDAQVPLAIPPLRYALYLDPTLQSQRRTLMGLYMQTGYWTEALEAATTVLATESPAQNKSDGEAHKVRADALFHLRRNPEATTAADNWCAADPASIDARLLRLDLAHIVDSPAIETDAMIDDWSSTHALSKTAIDLLKGHARVLNADPSEARICLTSAAADLPFDVQAAAPLVHDLDRVGLTDLALKVSRARHTADLANLTIRIDLVRREWIAQQFQNVVDLVAGVADRKPLPSETLGLEAVAKSELGHADQIKSIRLELSARTDLTSIAWSAVVGELASGQFEPDKLLLACGPALRDVDGPILRYYLGESYFALGDRQRAAREWQRVVSTELAWALPATHLCQLLTEDGRPKAAMSAGLEAVRRAPHDSTAAIALAQAWASAVDAGQDDDITGCLSLIDQLDKQLPDEPKLLALQASVLAHGGRGVDSATVIRQALAGTRVLPEQVWFDLAAASSVAQLGLEQQCLDRNRKEHGITARSAYARAVTLHFAPGSTTESTSPEVGLAAFDADRQLAGATAATDVAWSLARAKYLDVTRSSKAKQAWATLSDEHLKDAQIQQLVTLAAAVQSDRIVMGQAVGRILTAAGSDSVIYHLAKARIDVTFGTTQAEADESRRLLDDILAQSPDSLDARILSARAYEKSAHPIGAINELKSALTIDSDSVPVRLALARLLQSQGDFNGAMDQFDRLDLARLTTDDQRQQAATLLVQHGQADRAIGLLRGPVESQSPTGRLMLARLYQRTGQSEQALAVIEELLKGRPSPSAIAFDADLLASMGRVEEGAHALDQLSELPPGEVSPAIVDLMRGTFMLRYQSSWRADAALSMFAAASDVEPANPTVWRARISAELSLNHYSQAIAVASSGAEALPDDSVLTFFRSNGKVIESMAADPTAHMLLDAALSDPSVIPAVTETINVIHSVAVDDRSIDWLVNRLIELQNKYPAFAGIDIYLMNTYRRVGRMDSAVSVATRAGQSFPDDPIVLKAESQTLAAAGRWSAVIQIAGKWKRQSFGDSLEADLTAADAMIKSGRALEVADLLKPYTQNSGVPGYQSAIIALGRSEVAAGQLDPEVGMQQLLSQGAGGRAAWMLFAVDSLPPDQAAFDIRRATSQMSPADALEHVTASEMWMQLADRTGDKSFAKSAVETLEPYLSQPNPLVPVLLASASWAEKTGDVDRAEVLYRRVLVAEPNLPAAANNLAMILARSGRLDEARILIDNAIKIAPTLADLFDTRAFVLWKAVQLEPALADMKQALRLDPGRRSFRVRRIQLLAADGKTKDAWESLRQMETDYADAALTTAEVRKDLDLARAALKP